MTRSFAFIFAATLFVSTPVFAQSNACDGLMSELAEVDAEAAQVLAAESRDKTIEKIGANLEEASGILGAADKLAQQPYLVALEKWEDTLLDETQKLAKLIEKSVIVDLEKTLGSEFRDARTHVAKVKEIADRMRGIMSLAQQVSNADEFDAARTLKTLSEAYGPLKDLIGPLTELVPGVGPFLSYYGDSLNHAANKLAEVQKQQDYKRHIIDNVFNPDGVPAMRDKVVESRAKKLKELNDRRDVLLEKIKNEPDCDFKTDEPGVDEDQRDHDVANALCRHVVGIKDGETPSGAERDARRDFELAQNALEKAQKAIADAQAELDTAQSEISRIQRILDLREKELSDSTRLALAALSSNASNRIRLRSVQQNFPGYPGTVNHPACRSALNQARDRNVSTALMDHLIRQCVAKGAVEREKTKLAPLQTQAASAQAALDAAMAARDKARDEVDKTFRALLDATGTRATYEECMNREDKVPGHLDISGRYIDDKNGTVYEVSEQAGRFAFRYTEHLPFFAKAFGITSGDTFIIAQIKDGKLIGIKQLFTPLKKLAENECGFKPREWVEADALIWAKGEWLSLSNRYRQYLAECETRGGIDIQRIVREKSTEGRALFQKYGIPAK